MTADSLENYQNQDGKESGKRQKCRNISIKPDKNAKNKLYRS
ncbi:3363_t:CDS:2 [Racocetra persica]|uniref:3363_t:CDS:1 n=1 Tax=Racocetra persica TaxID=160502 RepID=A0ACA9PVW4_9GLOM|nr:3363_t:CDS:2 [Racocetra persica]